MSRRHHSRVVSTTSCPVTATAPVTVTCPTFTTRAVAATPSMPTTVAPTAIMPTAVTPTTTGAVSDLNALISQLGLAGVTTPTGTTTTGLGATTSVSPLGTTTTVTPLGTTPTAVSPLTTTVPTTAAPVDLSALTSTLGTSAVNPAVTNPLAALSPLAGKTSPAAAAATGAFNPTTQAFTNPIAMLGALNPFAALAASNPAAALLALSPTLNIFNPAINPNAALLNFNPAAAPTLALSGKAGPATLPYGIGPFGLGLPGVYSGKPVGKGVGKGVV